MPQPAEGVARLRNAAVRGAYRVGWRVAARLPQPVVALVIEIGSRVALRLGGRAVHTLRHNLGVAAGAPAGDPLVRAALASYLRTLVEVLALPGATAALTERVRTVNEGVLRSAYATTGAVVALPHSGNWDLAGAWACRTGMPVSTVAERLADAEYAAFSAFRTRLGIEVLAHSETGVIGRLVQAVRHQRLVCLLADRDLGGTGVPVRWRGHPVTMPGGPAMIARRSGAALIPAVCSYHGDQMLITFGPVVEPRPGRDGIVAMTQDVADFFAARVAAKPEDWHLLQPFFRSSAAGATFPSVA